MKKKIYLSLLAIFVVIASFGIGAYAAVKYSLVINGKSVKADIKVINGTPYIPLTALSGNLKGITVKQDSKKGTITIDEPKAADATSSASSVGLSRKNPAPIGTTVKASIKDILNNYQATFKVEEVIRGAKAWEMIEQANRFNDPPADGYEYMLVKLTVGVTKNSKPDATVNLNGVSFKLVSSVGKDYDFVSVVVPDPTLDANLYEGASNTGWAAFKVKTDDATPLLTFGRNYDGTGGVWLKVN